MSRELDALVARFVCGWRGVWIHTADGTVPLVVDGPRRPVLEAGGVPPDRDPANENHYTAVPAYSSDLNHCREAELRFVDKFCHEAYMKALYLEVTGDVALPQMEQWLAVSVATAEQRCRAMLRAMGVEVPERVGEP